MVVCGGHAIAGFLPVIRGGAGLRPEQHPDHRLKAKIPWRSGPGPGWEHRVPRGSVTALCLSVPPGAGGTGTDSKILAVNKT